ncbi:MAG: pyruvate,orthophosphate dikinase [Psychromonas sp.]
MKSQVNAALKNIELQMSKGFDDPVNPLLLSVSSGVPSFMPGMIDTVLNLDINDQTVQGLINLSGDPCFTYDSYRRFIQMYATLSK